MKRLLVSLGIACSLGFYACDEDDAKGNTGLNGMLIRGRTVLWEPLMEKNCT